MLCVGCLECVEACVYKQPKFSDEFNLGLSKRKPVYLPFPQAVPQVVVIDPETCIEFKSGKCKKTCIEACGERQAIDLKQQERIETIEVGAIILATGFQVFDARRIPYYGYGQYPNVYTSLEVERLVNAAGPTGGELVLRDGRKPRAVGIVHCAGSRDGRLIVQVEDTLLCQVRKAPVDMVILAVGLEPKADAQQVRRLFNISCSGEGFFLERHPKLAPVSTFTDGIYLAGCCQGPKDIPDTVAQAGAAAAEAFSLLDAGSIELEPNTAYVLEEACSGCKTCIGLCPYSAIAFRAERNAAAINEALCKGCGTCAAACPSGSIRQHLFEDEQILEEVAGVLA